MNPEQFRIRKLPSVVRSSIQRSNSVSRHISQVHNLPEVPSSIEDQDLRKRVTERQTKDLTRAQSLLRYRPITKAERTYSFIYDKKVQNSVKYSEGSKINNNAASINKGTFSLLLNIRKKDDGANFSHFKDKVSSKSKFKIKWKTIQWLIENKRETIEALCAQYELIIKIFRNKGPEGLDRAEFGELLIYVGLGAEKGLADKLFYIFDDDGNKRIDYRELIMGLETFIDSTFEQKLLVFFELCDVDGTGYISKKSFYDIFKRNCTSDDQKLRLKKIISLIFLEADKDRIGKCHKNALITYAAKSQQLRASVEESIRSIREIDKLIENDLQEPFNAWLPVSGNIVNAREGVHFPLVRKFIDAIKEQEDLKQDSRRKNQESSDILKKIKALAGQDAPDSDDESYE